MKKHLLLIAALFSINVNAGSVSNKTVDHLGIQSSTLSYFSIKDGLPTNCMLNVIYVSMTDEFGRAAYSTLLQAKASDKKINFDYSQDATSGVCFLQKIEII